MTDPKESLRFELAQYVEREEHLNKEDKLKILTAILEKCFNYENALHLITEHDILVISNLSKTAYAGLSLPLNVGVREMAYDDLRTIAHIEAVVSYMNNQHLLRKVVQINYKKH